MKWSEVKITQSCPTLCDPMDYIVHGILQAGTQAWVAFPFSRGSSQPRDRTQVSRIASGFFTSRATREAHELTANQKKCLFKVFGLLLFYVRTMNNFSIALWHTMKSGFYTATSDDQLTKSSKTFLKAKFAPKKKKRCSHCLGVCCQFDPPHLSESQQNHYIWEVSSTNWWGYAWKLQYLQPVLVNRKGPILFHDNTQLHITQPMLQRMNKLGYKILSHCHVHLTSSQGTITSSSISTKFCRENAPTTSRR